MENSLQGPSPRAQEPPFSPTPVEEVISSDDEELGPELEAQLKAQQEQFHLKFNTAHNTITQKNKDDEAAAARRKRNGSLIALPSSRSRWTSSRRSTWNA